MSWRIVPTAVLTGCILPFLGANVHAQQRAADPRPQPQHAPHPNPNFPGPANHTRAQQSYVRFPGRAFPTFQNPFINYPLTPYIGVGQYASVMNTLAYASLFGRLPPGNNTFALNYPLSPYMSVGQAAALMSLYGGGFPGYGGFGMAFNPYQAALYGGGGYPMGYPGGGYGGMQPYGGSGAMTGYGAGNQYANRQQLTTAPKPVNALDSLRVHGGGLDWPLGLREMEPKDDVKELRQEIDDTVKTMFDQPGGTDSTTKLLEQVSGQIDKLDRLYKARVWDMALTRQQEADVRRFLHKVRDALTAAKESGQFYAQSQLSSSGRQYQKGQQQQYQKGQQPGPRDVGVHDNYFEPKSLEIAAGTKVRWKSDGKHQHTITADDDEWLSLDLKPGSEVTVTFTKPGTYHYHCNIHPKAMRGTIIVK